MSNNNNLILSGILAVILTASFLSTSSEHYGFYENLGTFIGMFFFIFVVFTICDIVYSFIKQKIIHKKDYK